MEGADCCQYLMCKTGANLCIGKAKMQRYLSQIHVDSVPVKVVAFDRGEEIPSAERTEYIPFQSVVVNMPVPVGDQLGVSFDHSTTTSHVEMFLQVLGEVVRM
jgi:hypothetical protein